MSTPHRISPITFLDPQPRPGDPDRVWFTPSSSHIGLYSVTRARCSCPAGTYHPESLCKHRRHLLDLLDEDAPSMRPDSTNDAPVCTER